MKAIAFNGESYLIEKEDGQGCIYSPSTKKFGQDHTVVSLLSKGYWELLDSPVEVDEIK